MLHDETRKLLIEAWNKTHNAKEIAECFSVNTSTVYRLEKQMREIATPDNRDRDKRANCPAEQQIPRLYAEQIPDRLPPGDAPCRKTDGKRTNLHPAGRQPCTRLFRHLCVENALNTHQCAGKQRC